MRFVESREQQRPTILGKDNNVLFDFGGLKGSLGIVPLFLKNKKKTGDVMII